MLTARYLIVGSLVMASLLVAQQRGAAQGRDVRSEAHGMVKSIDATAGTITLSVGGGRGTPAMETTYTLAKDVEIAFGGTIGRLGGLFKEAKLADLGEGINVHLGLSADKKTVESIMAEAPVARGVVKSIDAKANTLTIDLGAGRGDTGGEEKTYRLAADAEIAVDDGRGRRFSMKEGKLEDIAQGAIVSLRLTLDKKQITSVFAEGKTIIGIVKNVEAANKKLTLVTRPARGDEAAEEQTFPVPSDALIVLDDGRGRLLSLKEAKLADIPVGASVGAKLSVDQTVAMFLRVEGPTVSGIFKAVDADKGTITIGIPRGRGEDPEEKTYTLAKRVRVAIDGAESKLTNLKAEENGPIVQLRLSLDQRTVQAVQSYTPRARE